MRIALDLITVGVLLVLPTSVPLAAKDYGVAGQALPVIEPDLLATIEGRLRRAAATGEIDRANQTFARRAEQKIRRPNPVAGLSPATEARSWQFDPAITIERDVRDHKGNLVAGRGQRVNPLDFVTVRQALVFVDGDDAGQMAWATARYDELRAKIILVDGSPIEEMTRRKRRFFFDQEGRLTQRFGIRHTPAVVTQAGKVMNVDEIVLKAGRPS